MIITVVSIITAIINNVSALKLFINSLLSSIHERFFFILSYLKFNPLQEQRADLFNMSQQHCNEFVHHLKEVLDIALSGIQMMPAQNQTELEAKLNKEFADKTKDRVLLHDGSERKIPRPLDENEQEEKYRSLLLHPFRISVISLDGAEIKQPQAKPKGKYLSQEQKAQNPKISSFRVRVEHTIGDAKN